MLIDWTTYRLLCCTAGDLEAERAAFDAANAKFAECVTMPERILFALASPHPDFNPHAQRNALESNIRFCDFFLQIFSETAPREPFHEFVELAIACTDNPAFPMRSTVVMFRNSESATPEMAAFRRQLLEGGQCQVRDFHSPEEFEALSGEVLATWYALIQSRSEATGSSA
jgi:hypothetical protein